MITREAGSSKRRGIRGLAIIGLIAMIGGNAAVAKASTSPGRDGSIVALSGRLNTAIIGVATPRKTLRTLFSRSLSEIYFADLSVSPDGRSFAYDVRAGTIGASLETLDLTRHEAKGIGTHQLAVNNPAYLANGRIIFAGAHAQGAHPGTFEMLANGAHLHKLFAAEQIATSPDGRSFVITDHKSSYRTLLLLDRRGRRLRKLTPPAKPGADLRYLDATFSPNGRWIAYERRIEPRQGRYHHYRDIFIVRRDGTHRRRLTFGGNSGEPVFSPSGNWVAYVKFTRVQSGGNLAKVSVRDPHKHHPLTSVHRASFYSPAWLPR